MFNYKYIVHGNKVICLSTFAGKAVRGIARCAPCDEFDVEKGKKLATARCAEKVARKRYDRANRKVKEAYEQFLKASEFYRHMLKYQRDAERALIEANDAAIMCAEEM